MDVSVADYARERGISRQRALAMIHAGQIAARRVGRAWVIDQRELNNRAALGRPLSARMCEILIDAVSQHPRTDLGPQDRFVVNRYLDRLRNSEEPALLLHSWMKARQLTAINVAANPSDLVELAQDNRVVPSGISDERSGMSAVREFEGYVSAGDVEALIRDALLVKSASPNVRLHVVKEAPRRPIPLGFVLADLADWNRPREDGRVAELLKGVSF